MSSPYMKLPRKVNELNVVNESYIQNTTTKSVEGKILVRTKPPTKLKTTSYPIRSKLMRLDRGRPEIRSKSY